jgi:hypothetical protein
VRELTRRTLALGHHTPGPRLRSCEADNRRLRRGLEALAWAAPSLSPQAVRDECLRLLREKPNEEASPNG